MSRLGLGISKGSFWNATISVGSDSPKNFVYYIYGRKKNKLVGDELVVYLFFSSIYTSLYFFVLSTVLHIFALYVYSHIDKTTQTQNIPNTLRAILNVGMGINLLITFLAGKNITN